MSPTRKFRDYLTEKLEDPAEAAVYLSVALEEYETDSNREAFLLALRTVRGEPISKSHPPTLRVARRSLNPELKLETAPFAPVERRERRARSGP